MKNEMSKISSCNAATCSYNREMLCRALAINVGGSGAFCNAFVNMDIKCEGDNFESGIGACKMKDCRFNDCLMCTSPSIDIEMNGIQAMCNKFVAR